MTGHRCRNRILRRPSGRLPKQSKRPRWAHKSHPTLMNPHRESHRVEVVLSHILGHALKRPCSPPPHTEDLHTSRRCTHGGKRPTSRPPHLLSYSPTHSRLASHWPKGLFTPGIHPGFSPHWAWARPCPHPLSRPFPCPGTRLGWDKTGRVT